MSVCTSATVYCDPPDGLCPRTVKAADTVTARRMAQSEGWDCGSGPLGLTDQCPEHKSATGKEA